MKSFEAEVLKKADIAPIADDYPSLIWMDDDFLNDEAVPFDFEAFRRIDTGIRYLNPGHFSVIQLLSAIGSSQKPD